MSYSSSLGVLAAIGLPLAGGLLGARITRTEVRGEWYLALKQPSWRPPAWLFGPVWTTLYCSMGYASYLVARDAPTPGDAAAVSLRAAV